MGVFRRVTKAVVPVVGMANRPKKRFLVHDRRYRISNANKETLGVDTPPASARHDLADDR